MVTPGRFSYGRLVDGFEVQALSATGLPFKAIGLARRRFALPRRSVARADASLVAAAVGRATLDRRARLVRRR